MPGFGAQRKAVNGNIFFNSEEELARKVRDVSKWL
jgi:hypothetical protein